MKDYTLFSYYKKFAKADLFSTYFKFMFPNLSVKFIDIAYKNKIKCIVKSNNENNFNIFKEHFDKLDLLNESDRSNVFESNYLKYIVTGYNPLRLGLRVLNKLNKKHCLEHPSEFDYDLYGNVTMHYFNDDKFIGDLNLQTSESLYDCIGAKGNRYHIFASNDEYINFIKLNIFK